MNSDDAYGFKASSNTQTLFLHFIDLSKDKVVVKVIFRNSKQHGTVEAASV